MAVAVISEFNPFHNGHKYFVKKIRELTGEPVIAVMSGNFVQRGDVAVTSKFERAEAALNNGVDLVVELPTVFAVANAQRFATCGVEIAKSFSSVSHLAFGCESDDINLLNIASQAVDSPTVGAIVKQKMKSGVSYPNALEYAVENIYGKSVAKVLSSPNNVLATEYLRALNGSSIEPLPIKRLGVEHDSNDINKNIASASQIRKMLKQGDCVSSLLPNLPNNIADFKNLEPAMLYKLRTMSIQEFACLPDVKEGLENRIFDAVHKYNSYEDIIKAVKTKRYTLARLRRIFVCALLGITEEQQSARCSYVRVLGFTNDGEKLLKDCSFDVVTSVAKATKKEGVNSEFLKIDVKSGDVFSLSRSQVTKCGQDFTSKIIKIKHSK